MSRFTTILILLVIAGQAAASQSSRTFAQGVSQSVIAFLAVSELSMYADGHRGRNAAVQGLKAFAVTDAASTLLKAAVHERRPDGQSNDSFPSLHTSAAFSMATVVSRYDSEWGIPAYGAAALVGWSRVENRDHYWHDVIAGAALGYFVARAFTRDNSAFSTQTMGCSISW